MTTYFQEVLGNMLKECRMFGLKEKEESEKIPSRMKIPLETVEIPIP